MGFLLWNSNNYTQRRIIYEVKELLTEKILVFGVQDITNRVICTLYRAYNVRKASHSKYVYTG